MLQRGQGGASLVATLDLIAAVWSASGYVAAAGDVLGLGSTAVTVWDIAKWPVLLVVSFLFALPYWASPNAKQGFRWVARGGILALVLWLAASAGFAVYVAGFSSYNKTYGSLAGEVPCFISVHGGIGGQELRRLRGCESDRSCSRCG